MARLPSRWYKLAPRSHRGEFDLILMEAAPAAFQPAQGLAAGSGQASHPAPASENLHRQLLSGVEELAADICGMQEQMDTLKAKVEGLKAVLHDCMSDTV